MGIKTALGALIVFSIVALAILLAVTFYMFCVDLGIFDVVHGHVGLV